MFENRSCVYLLTLAVWILANTLKAAPLFTNLFSFNATNGTYPEGHLVRALDGNLYGTTRETTDTTFGGWSGTHSHGTFFRITTNGTLTTLFRFTNSDGAYPRGGLILGDDGNLYGTTTGGGAKNNGTIFRITTNGLLTTLATFSGANGACPVAPLLQSSDGKLYGTTTVGGVRKRGIPSSLRPSQGLFDYGTIFSITKNGALKTLICFNGTNGANPYAGVIEGRDGCIYGTTVTGGTNDPWADDPLRVPSGTIFKIDKSGVLSTLASFNGPNGTCPLSIEQSGNGDIYGITGDYGGDAVPNSEGRDQRPFSGFGTVFKLEPNGELKNLVVFNGSNGMYPSCFLLASDGSFYGITRAGGAYSHGTIFRMKSDGEMTTLYSFSENTDQPSLMEWSDGDFYGTTSSGGKFGRGRVFRFRISE